MMVLAEPSGILSPTSPSRQAAQGICVCCGAHQVSSLVPYLYIFIDFPNRNTISTKVQQLLCPCKGELKIKDERGKRKEERGKRDGVGRVDRQKEKKRSEDLF
jgi:hypothetical protein